MKNSFKQWIMDHDERWSFIFLYVGAAILLSIYLNLFWVTMLLAANFLLKVYRNNLISLTNPVVSALWQIKLDVSLILFSLAVAIYAEHIFAALGLGQAARAGVAVRSIRFATRFGVLERGMKVFLMTVDDLARLLRVVARISGNGNGDSNAAVQSGEPAVIVAGEDRSSPWLAAGKGDWFSLAFGLFCLALIMSDPLITGSALPETIAHVVHELSPHR